MYSIDSTSPDLVSEEDLQVIIRQLAELAIEMSSEVRGIYSKHSINYLIWKNYCSLNAKYQMANNANYPSTYFF
jgi:hypothetical protein